MGNYHCPIVRMNVYVYASIVIFVFIVGMPKERGFDENRLIGHLVSS
jgi:hypothetical protein